MQRYISKLETFITNSGVWVGNPITNNGTIVETLTTKNGMLIEIGDGKIKLVATDGHRLALTEMDVTANAFGEGARRQRKGRAAKRVGRGASGMRMTRTTRRRTTGVESVRRRPVPVPTRATRAPLTPHD